MSQYDESLAELHAMVERGENIDSLVGHPHPYIRAHIATLHHEKHGLTLSQDPSSVVRLAVVHSTQDNNLLRSLCQDKDEKVRFEANKKLSYVTILEKAGE